MIERVDILGCKIDAVTMEQAVDHIENCIRKQQICQVATANAEIVYAAQHNPRLFLALHDAGLVTADGMGIILAARMLKQEMPAKVSGVDLVHKLIEHSLQAGWRFYLLGATDEVLQAAAARLAELYPGVQVVGSHHGYFKQSENDAILADIRASKADIVLVAMGAPKQDIWLHENLAKSGATVGIGVGGTFAILAGTDKRAPLWMQRSGLEWLFRLIQQPSRWRRTLALPKFVWAVWRQRSEQ